MGLLDEIIGQDALKEHIQNALGQQKVSHAYLLQGEKGSGKEYIASLFAMGLQCLSGGEKPCGECISCKKALHRNHPDILYLQKEKPGSIGVDDIRVQINDSVVIKPYEGERKVYIIPESDKMTVQAQNALLKTLEEPPSYVVIFLLVENMQQMLPTILSRCVSLPMRPVPDEQIRRYLMEQMQIPDYQADLSVSFARGNLGKAKMLAKDEDFEQIRQEALRLVKHAEEMELQDILKAIHRITEFKLEIQDYMDLIAVWYRDVLLFKATSDANHLIFREEVQYIKKVASKCSYEGLEEILQALDKAKIRMKANVNQELALELLFLTIRDYQR